jgi:general secretion pathway protein M
MAMPKPIADRGRVLAGVAIAGLLAYFVLVHWWFTAPMLTMGEEIDALRDQQANATAEIAQRPAIEAKLAQVRAFEAGNPGFLPEGNKQLASAGLIQRLETVVGAGGNPAACQITARTPTDSTAKDLFPRVVVQVRLRCGVSELTAVMHALESGHPQLFIDNVDMMSRRSSYLSQGPEGTDGALDVSFDLYGYLKAPAAGGPGA